jgi:hypothetical protein
MFDAAIEVGSFGGKTERERKKNSTEIEMAIERQDKEEERS